MIFNEKAEVSKEEISKEEVSKEEVSKKEVSKKESAFWQTRSFNMAKIIYNNNKPNPLKTIKSLFSKNFKEITTKEQKTVVLVQ